MALAMQRRSHGDSIWGMFFVVLEASGAGCRGNLGLPWNAVTNIKSFPWYGKSPARTLERFRWHGKAMEIDLEIVLEVSERSGLRWIALDASFLAV